jgi:hypothetical protein
MKENLSSNHPIRVYFSDAVQTAFEDHLGICDRDVENYLVSMLVSFLDIESVYAVKNRFGQSVRSVAEMAVEGDIRLNADSFDREREVHRHIGDFLLFWSGVFPEFLKFVCPRTGKDALIDPIGQGRYSYQVASSFDHDPYTEESKILRKLSNEFEAYRYGLGLVRASFEGFRRQGWHDGFQA